VGKRITLTSAAIMLLSRLLSRLSPPQAKENSTPARLLMPSKWRIWEWHIPAATVAQDTKMTFKTVGFQLIMVAATVQRQWLWSAVGMRMDADLSARHTLGILSKRWSPSLG
jgi:hypothetical protein